MYVHTYMHMRLTDKVILTINFSENYKRMHLITRVYCIHSTVQMQGYTRVACILGVSKTICTQIMYESSEIAHACMFCLSRVNYADLS